MKELNYISYIEELNGLNEAIYLLEERLQAGADDKETRLRLLFLYWYMEHEPSYITNDKGGRNWRECFLTLLSDCAAWHEDVDFNWIVGYLLYNYPSIPNFKDLGEELLIRAVKRGGHLPQLALAATKNCADSFTWLEGDETELLDSWGMMGEYFRNVLRQR